MKPGRMANKTALALFKEAGPLELGRMADEFRAELHPGGTVTFVVDRNINYTNVCINRCRFCAFYRDEDHPEGYVLSRDELFEKVEETLSLGGTQILIQGGLNPGLDLDYYLDLLGSIKERFDINVHGFSPPEITHIAEGSDITVREALGLLREAGLDSIPGGGAEILTDRVREFMSPRKLKVGGWLKVMREAHGLGMRTTATMMFGANERAEDIIEHLERIRELQDSTGGFTAFIPWSFQPGNTEFQGMPPATAVDYLRVLAISRLYLDNVPNIQASWVTQGLKMAQVALRFGANDMGSTMIEENVVKAAGVSHKVSLEEMVGAIKAAGFVAAQRDTYYNLLKTY
ncbi:MAG: cyclic dehypoxanthinyl futalosine synthase [Nitrospirota bacterium]|jgi:cyclic dehypoxanthinyl futalosine synthase